MPEPARPIRRTGTGRVVLRWHRRLGITLSLLFLVVCFTGLFLNHSERLDLRAITLDSEWLYNWYGMQPESEPISFKAAEQTITVLEDQLFLDGKPIQTFSEPIVGTTEVEGLIFVAGSDTALLLSPEGELIERLGSNALPGKVSEVASAEEPSRVILNTDQGSFSSDSNFLEWLPYDASAANWTSPTETPEAIERSVYEAYRGQPITLYRIVLDLHSGRFFGSWGWLLADLSAIGMILLTVSGLYYAFRLRRPQSANTKGRDL